MLKIRVGDFRLGRKEKDIINEVLDIGQLSEGAKVREFETRWAEFIGTKYCVAVNSGTSALIAGLCALKSLYNIKDGSGVITSPLTFVATVNAIKVSGLKPLFVDVDKKNFCVKADEIEKMFSTNRDISVILPVHLMGFPADMVKINSIAKKYSCRVLEDCAQAHGTGFMNKKVGTYSDLATYSFYIAHNVQAGEMGAVVTSNPELYRLVKKIKAHGRMCDCPICLRAKGDCPRLSSYQGTEDFDPRFYHDMIGFNFKTMEFQAALAIIQLQKVNEILKKRQANVKYLNEGLKPFEKVIQLPLYSDDYSYLAYPVVILKPDIISRQSLRKSLEDNGIETRPLFGCIPTQQPAYSFLKEQYEGRLPNAEYLGRNAFYIGCHQYISKKDLDYIISVFKKIL